MLILICSYFFFVLQNYIVFIFTLEDHQEFYIEHYLALDAYEKAQQLNFGHNNTQSLYIGHIVFLGKEISDLSCVVSVQLARFRLYYCSSNIRDISPVGSPIFDDKTSY